MFRIVLLTLLSFNLVGCGFNFRSAKTWPSQLHQIDINTKNLALQEKISQALKSVDVSLTSNAAYRLTLSNYIESTQSNKSISVNEPYQTPITASITASLWLDDQLIRKQRFIAKSTSITPANYQAKLRPNQNIISTLQDNLVQQLYFWLKSTPINHHKTTHAT